MSYEAPFAGLKVVDLSQGVAGPYCGMLLAQYGADVIKVEPTGEGDWARTLGTRYGDQSAYSIPANLGKRSVALDLKSAQGKDVLWRLIAGADVLLEGFRPGVLDRLGFGYEAVSQREPRILYLSVSGFGQTGPFSGRPAMDPVLQAFTGLMLDNKGEDGIPHRVPFVVIDMSTALHAFQALSAALYARRDQPRGRRIEVSLLQTATAMQVIRMLLVYSRGRPDQARHAERRVQDGRRLAAVPGHPQRQLGEVLPHRAGNARVGDRSAFRQRGGAHDQRGAAAGHRAAGHRRQAHRLLVGAPARGRHHARAAEHLPRSPCAIRRRKRSA